MREGSCVHWAGIRMADRNAKCEAGVPFVAMDGDKAPGVFRRVPCLAANESPSFECPKRRFPTPDEVAKAEAEFKLYVDAVVKVMEAIGKQPKGGSGEVPCPKCGGTIRWIASSYNGHRHAACQTPNCIQVME